MEQSSQRWIDSRPIGLSFHCRTGSPSRDLNRRSCSASDTEHQYLRSRIPSSISICSKIGVWRMNRVYSCGVQKPMTRSTPDKAAIRATRRVHCWTLTSSASYTPCGMLGPRLPASARFFFPWDGTLAPGPTARPCYAAALSIASASSVTERSRPAAVGAWWATISSSASACPKNRVT